MSDTRTQAQRNADVDCTWGQELIAAFQQAEMFYSKAADHLCDYADVIDLFRHLGAESHRLGAELSESFRNVPEALSVETDLERHRRAICLHDFRLQQSLLNESVHWLRHIGHHIHPVLQRADGQCEFNRPALRDDDLRCAGRFCQAAAKALPL